jgi:hypothetical protein
MSAPSLYELLGVPAEEGVGRDFGRTERTSDVETIDNDRSHADLWSRSVGAPAASVVRGRTEITKEVETVDRDRAHDDLYSKLSAPSKDPSADLGRTEDTRTIETIDKDRHAAALGTTLLGPARDLYGVLAVPTSQESEAGHPEMTDPTETADWDRPPELG